MFDNFRLAKFEVVMEAGPKGLFLPPYKGSTLRGGFGSAFRRLVCFQQQANCSECILTNNCPYSFVFESSPRPGATVLRNYQDIPRPFVLEPPAGDQTYYHPGEKLVFNLVLIGSSIQYLPYFILVLKELGEQGLGKGRLPAVLREVAAVNDLNGQREIIFPLVNGMVRNDLDLSVRGTDILERWSNCNIPETVIEFETMTRLKYEEALSGIPEFHIVVRHLLRRASTLLAFYHDSHMELDYKAFIEAAKQVTLIENNTKWVDWERYSNRQGTRMLLGGIVGTARYEGKLEPFVPLLKLGEHIHLGKSVVFGMGKIKV